MSELFHKGSSYLTDIQSKGDDEFKTALASK